MPKFIDLTGQVFGKLTVIEPTEERYNKSSVVFKCLCECGNYRNAPSILLKAGTANSCGCTKYTLLGQVFDKLTVISAHEERSSQGLIQYNCLCECGNTKIVPSRYLTDGWTRSCGCLGICKDRTGQKYGKLTVLGLLELRTNTFQALYACLCECGNFKTARGNHLQAGSVTNCGCVFNRFKKPLPKKEVNKRPEPLDLVGKKINRFLVVSLCDYKHPKGDTMYTCQCECGTIKDMKLSVLNSGKVLSCGCAHFGKKNPRQARIPECGHPEAEHGGLGLCNPCYEWYRQTKPGAKEANTERCKRSRGIRKAKNPERHKAKSVYNSQKERVIEYDALDDGTITVDSLEELFKITNCFYCDEFTALEFRTLEHLLPLSRGGDHSLSNAAMACLTCNCSKHSKTIDEFYAYIDHLIFLRDIVTKNSEEVHPC